MKSLTSSTHLYRQGTVPLGHGTVRVLYRVPRLHPTPPRQVLALSSKGIRVMSVEGPVCWSEGRWCSSFRHLLYHFNLDKVTPADASLFYRKTFRRLLLSSTVFFLISNFKAPTDRTLQVHLFGAGLGGYLAQKFAEITFRNPMVVSLILCNSFSDTSEYSKVCS